MLTDNSQVSDVNHASRYVARLNELLAAVDYDSIGRVADALRGARADGCRVFLAGNGGSAATAAHWCNDLGKATKRAGCGAMMPMCLSDNISWLTALANDEGYERVFSGQLENFAHANDVLVAISASGNSPNLVRAVEKAKQMGVRTIGFLGFDGGILKSMVDECVWVRTEKGAYELVEDAHMVICHILTTCLCADRPQVHSAMVGNE